MAAGELTGILLVGGASRRFGSAKALATFEGSTLAERAWQTLGRVASRRIAVGKAADALPLPFDLLDDGSEVRAPLAGIVAGLKAARSDVAVVVPVDVPLLRAQDLRRLVDACRGADVAAPQSGPLPCALRRAVLPALGRRLRNGELAVRDAFAELDARTVELDPGTLANANTPAELAALELRIVPLIPEHVEGFRALVADTLTEFGFTPDPELDPDLVDPGTVYEAAWVATRGGEVGGSVALRRAGPREVELKRMYLRPELRGHGVGRRLLAMALAWAREHGIERVVLDTSERMVAARGLYEAHGFVRVPGSAPRQGQERLLYQLRL